MYFRFHFAILLIVSGFALAASPMEDFDAAQQLAKREKKDVILSFQGVGRWWPTEGFYTETDDPWITQHFVLIEVPLNASASGEKATPVDRELVELRKWYHQDLNGTYDTFFLLDSGGRPYAELSVHEQPPEAYSLELKEALLRRANRDAAFEKARQANGLKKARLLNKGLRALWEDPDSGLQSLQGQILVYRHYQDVLAEIIRNDPKDVLSVAEDLEERKEFELDELKNKEADDQLKKLAGDLNRMLGEGSNLAAISAVIDKFLLSHPEYPEFRRQQVLAGKIEAALILRDYAAAQKVMDEVVSAFPNLEASKALKSKLRPEIETALKLAASGIDNAATAYAIRFDSYTALWLDADGSGVTKFLKDLDQPPQQSVPTLPTEEMDPINQELRRADLLLRLRDYKKALNALDRFMGHGAGSGRARREDRELRPIILRGLSKMTPTEGKSPGEE
ncbi:MAG: hypothetical protein CFE26_09730 [Verrucomicrobiales bacterium VVV1]|nr:MAG: hypothetical protein CFE26_09730 [Verrucomicrobiales bacterium VVV1]